MTDRPSPTPPPPLDLHGLRAVSVLGRGAKGVVFLVRDSTSQTLALKAISRSSIEKKNANADAADAYRRIWFERDVLLSLRHPFLPSLRGVVSTESVVGFLIDRCSGGDLSALRRRQSEKMFSDEIIRFYAAELVLALEYLHKLGIVYRDLKPDNILIQETGHLMLVDFDLSVKLPSRAPEPLKPSNRRSDREKPAPIKKNRRLFSCFSSNAGVSPEIADSAGEVGRNRDSGSGKSNSFVGTEEYVAPEIIRGNGHDFAVDWWGLGVVLYEMLYGRTPFRGQNRKETFYRILTKSPELVGEQTALRDLIARLLEKEAEKRISCEEIKRHEFFRGVDWEAILTLSRPPFIPDVGVDWEEDGGQEGIDVEKFVEDVFGNGGNDGGDLVKEKKSEGNLEEGLKNPSKSGDFSEF